MLKIIRFNFFNPFLFPLLFLFGYLLFTLHFSDVLLMPNYKVTLYVLLSMCMYAFGTLVGFIIGDRKKAKNYIIKYSKNLTTYIFVLYLFSMTMFLFEYVICLKNFGTIPILSSDIETLRFEFPVNGYIHLLAIMSYPLLFILLVDRMKYPNNHSLFYKRILSLFTFFSLFFALGLGGRGTIVIFLIYLFIAYSFLNKINLKKLIFYAFIGLYLMGAIKLFRDFMFYGPSVFESIENNWIFGKSFLMMPFFFSYLGIAMNYSVLTAYINNLDAFYYGYFTISKPFLDLLPGKGFSFIDLQLLVLDKDFHGVLTNTILGAPYVDFSYFGSIILMFLGIIVGREYILIMKYKLLRNILPYSFIYAMLIMGIYTYPFGNFHILLYIVIIKIFGVLLDKIVVKRDI
jgi:oligosaccharide repeat unit polymerase